jgi:hypothetical protein
MRVRWGGVALVLSVAVALLVAPASPAAETFSFGPGSVTFARVSATHGYRVNFSENDKGYFFVRVKGHGATTDFATHTARARPGHLLADFGRRGRFDLRFVPVGKPEPIPTGGLCDGKKGSWQVGYLVGAARFRTERGFARIAIHRVPAARESWARLTCELGHIPLPGHPKEKRTTFDAVATPPTKGFSLAAPKRTLGFDVTQFYRHAKPADQRVAFAATLKERAGRVSIRRQVKVATGERSLLFPGLPPMPEEVEVKPPAPFTGSGEFLRTHESTYTWTGDLAVTFPGLDPIRLTGPRFDITMCAARRCIARPAEERKGKHR